MLPVRQRPVWSENARLACGVPGFSRSSPSPSPVPSADVTVAYDAEGVAGRKIEISVAKHSCALIGSPFYYENDYNR